MKQSLQNKPSIWSFRDMRLVIPARAVSFFGDSLALVVLSLEVARSDRPILMTLLLVAFSLPMFLLAPVAGRLVDEHDSRTLLVAAGTLQVVASLGLVWGPNPVALLGFVLLLQAGQSVTAPTWGPWSRASWATSSSARRSASSSHSRPSPVWVVQLPEACCTPPWATTRHC